MKKIVLTGGPCAGKTKILNILQEKHGDEILFIPEAATIIFDSGYPRDGDDPSREWQVKFQGKVVETQMKLESDAIKEAKQKGINTIVFDRGVLDGAAYVGEGMDTFCKLYDLDLNEIISHYDKVLHLESRAIGDPESYGNNSNKHRREGVEAAVEVDHAIWDAWEVHPRHIHIPFTGEIEEKGRRVEMEIADLIE